MRACCVHSVAMLCTHLLNIRSLLAMSLSAFMQISGRLAHLPLCVRRSQLRPAGCNISPWEKPWIWQLTLCGDQVAFRGSLFQSAAFVTAFVGLMLAPMRRNPEVVPCAYA